MSKTTDSTLTFPCDYNLKIFGKTDGAFKADGLAIVKKHIGELDHGRIKERPSKDGNYLALTIHFTAHSKQTLDSLYQELSANELILMAL
jgi:uncharacterized protein